MKELKNEELKEVVGGSVALLELVSAVTDVEEGSFLEFKLLTAPDPLTLTRD